MLIVYMHKILKSKHTALSLQHCPALLLCCYISSLRLLPQKCILVN